MYVYISICICIYSSQTNKSRIASEKHIYITLYIYKGMKKSLMKVVKNINLSSRACSHGLKK